MRGRREEMNKQDGHLPDVGKSSADKVRQERREKAAREKEEADRQKQVRSSPAQLSSE